MAFLDFMAKISLDDSDFYKGMNNAEQKAKSLSTGVKAVTTAFTVAAGAAVAFAGASVKTGAEFDSAMSQVAATMGTTTDQITDLRDFAKEMGAQTAFSAREAAEALNYMALAGYDADTSMSMLPNVLNLAAAGGIELARASDMVTDAQSALGLSIDETSELVDKMARASSKSNTSVEQLGEAILTIGGTAKSLAGGTTELSAALGILADNGIKGAEGGTALRNVLLGIQSDKFEEVFGSMGVSAYDANGNLRDMSSILADMNRVMDGMTDQQKTDLINKTFNRQDLKSVNALLATSSKRWDELTESINNSQGAAQAMADTQLDNLQGDITLLKSAFEGFQIDLSEKLMPVARKVVQWATDLITNFDKIAPIVIGAATAFGTFAIAINIGNIIKGVTTAFQAFNAVLMMNPIALVVAAIAGLVAAIVYLWNNNEEFRAKVTAAWEAVKGAALALRDGIVNAWNVVVAKWNEVKSAAIALRDGIVGAWNAVVAKWNEVKGKANELKSAIVGKFNEIKSSITNIVNAAKNWGSQLISNFVQGLKNAWESLKSGVTNLAGAIAKPFKHSIPKDGPFKRDDLWGAHMIQNFTKGMLDEAPELLDAAERTAQSVADRMKIGNFDYGVSGYASNSYAANGSGGMVINGDVHISVDGTGKNAEQIARDMYKILLRQGVTAYAV